MSVCVKTGSRGCLTPHSKKLTSCPLSASSAAASTMRRSAPEERGKGKGVSRDVVGPDASLFLTAARLKRPKPNALTTQAQVGVHKRDAQGPATGGGARHFLRREKEIDGEYLSVFKPERRFFLCVPCFLWTRVPLSTSRAAMGDATITSLLRTLPSRCVCGRGCGRRGRGAGGPRIGEALPPLLAEWLRRLRTPRARVRLCHVWDWATDGVHPPLPPPQRRLCRGRPVDRAAPPAADLHRGPRHGASGWVVGVVWCCAWVEKGGRRDRHTTTTPPHLSTPFPSSRPNHRHRPHQPAHPLPQHSAQAA